MNPIKTPISLVELLRDSGFRLGRMLSGSKSGYRDRYPTHTVLFNANIFTEQSGKVWFGDLDLTIDGEKLAEIAAQCKQTLYVLRERDGRFENDNRPFAEVMMVAVQSYPHHAP